MLSDPISWSSKFSKQTINKLEKLFWVILKEVVEETKISLFSQECEFFLFFFWGGGCASAKGLLMMGVVGCALLSSFKSIKAFSWYLHSFRWFCVGQFFVCFPKFRCPLQTGLQLSESALQNPASSSSAHRANSICNKLLSAKTSRFSNLIIGIVMRYFCV